MNRKTSFALGLATVSLFAYGVLGHEDGPLIAMPDPLLTPGAVLDTDPTVICTPGYAKAHRVWRNKAATAAKYRIPWSVARNMEDDDLVPPGLGGNNANPANHWLQPCSQWRAVGNEGLRECITGQAFRKDQLEHGWEAEVRKACRIDGPSSPAAKAILHDGQAFFLTGAWTQYMRQTDE